ncbi:hypothetical protein [Nostoc sp.]|uniref:hypothetical protein n=1 Tax=Nostoc sp. TaxID=1180 RepID=UPI002FFBD019
MRSRKCKAIAFSFTDKRSLQGVESRAVNLDESSYLTKCRSYARRRHRFSIKM